MNRSLLAGLAGILLALTGASAAQAAPGQPGATLQALADALAGTVGFKLFTVLLHDPAAGDGADVAVAAVLMELLLV